MATVMKHHGIHHVEIERSGPQKAAIGIGIAFIVVGLAGAIMPGMLGMHLSIAHNFIHILSGALALYCGYANPRKAFRFCLGFGAVYGLLGIAGFVLGEPGYPAVGHLEADQNLFRVIPNVLEFGTMDHVVHIIIGAFLLFTAFTFRKDRNFYRREERVGDSYTLKEVNRRSTLGETDFKTKAR